MHMVYPNMCIQIEHVPRGRQQRTGPLVLAIRQIRDGERGGAPVLVRTLKACNSNTISEIVGACHATGKTF